MRSITHRPVQCLERLPGTDGGYPPNNIECLQCNRKIFEHLAVLSDV
jgi:hypothetical protein